MKAVTCIDYVGMMTFMVLARFIATCYMTRQSKSE